MWYLYRNWEEEAEEKNGRAQRTHSCTLPQRKISNCNLYLNECTNIFSIFVSEREGKLTERMWKKCVIWKKKLLGACVCASEVQWTQPVEQHIVAAALSMKWNVQAHTKKTISNSVIYYRKKVQLDAFSPSTLLCLLSYFVRTRAYALVRSFVASAP